MMAKSIFLHLILPFLVFGFLFALPIRAQNEQLDSISIEENLAPDGITEKDAKVEGAPSQQDEGPSLPSLTIITPSAGETLTGQVTLFVRVFNAVADRVEFRTLLGETALPIGSAFFNPNSNFWTYLWDTTEKFNGLYQLQAVAFDPLNQVISSAVITVEIKNSNQLIPTNSDGQVRVSLDIINPPDQSVLTGSVILKAKTNVHLPGLTFVFDNPKTSGSDFLGEAQLDGSDPKGLTWRRLFNTDLLADGLYRLYAQSSIGAAAFQSSAIRVVIENEGLAAGLVKEFAFDGAGLNEPASNLIVPEAQLERSQTVSNPWPSGRFLDFSISSGSLVNQSFDGSDPIRQIPSLLYIFASSLLLSSGLVLILVRR